MSKFKLSNRSKKNREGIDQRLIAISDRAIEITTVDFGHPSHSGLRTADDQKKLFNAGKSNADGTKHKSYHQTGRALDFYAYVDGGASWDPRDLAIVGAAHLQAASELGISIEWGGFWRKLTDMPHIQLHQSEKEID